MKISFNNKPVAIEPSNKVSSLRIDRYGNVYAVRVDGTSSRSERKQVLKALAKVRY